MIWSIIKLLFGCIALVLITMANCITWFLYFGWNKELYVLFWTDRAANIQYYYKGNVLAWAFKVRRLADSSFDITKKELIADEK
jgi:hypothetical protein